MANGRPLSAQGKLNSNMRCFMLRGPEPEEEKISTV